LRRICETALDLGNDSIAAQKLGRFIKDTTEVSGVISSARTQTKFLDNKVLQRNMEVSDFSFDELATGRTTIYLVLPADRLGTDGRWLRLMVSMAIRAVSRIRSSQNLPVVFMLDEFGTVGKLDAIETHYGLARGSGIAIWAVLQDLNQLQHDYPKKWQSFISSSAAVTSFGVMDEATAEHISKLLGTATVEYQTTSASSGTSTSASGASSSKSANTSFNVTGRPLLLPDEVRRLDSRLCLILGRHDPIVCRRLVYYEDSPFYLAARADPHFGSPERQRELAEVKTAAALVQLAERQIIDFTSAREALLPCGLIVEKDRRGRMAVRRGEDQVAEFRLERELIPWARRVMARQFHKKKLLF
jgi:type IV secretion system protein VirD4